MFKQSKRSRHSLLLALAAALLAALPFEIPNPTALKLTDAHAGDVASPAPDVGNHQYPAEPYPVPQSGFELIWNHLR